MATAVNPTVPAQQGPKTENETFYNLFVKNAEGVSTASEYVNKSSIDEETGEIQYVSEGKLEDIQKEAATKQHTVEITRVQTFKMYEATSLDELQTLVPQRALEFGNYGFRLAQQNFRRDWMRDATSTPVEGALDTLPEVQEPKERAKASPKDKVINQLAKLMKEYGLAPDKAAIDAMLAKFIAEQPGGQSTAEAAQPAAQ